VPELDPLLGPEPLHDGQLLLEAGAAFLEIDAVQRELVGLVADRDAEHEPAVGDHVQHRHILGQSHRVVEGGDDDVGAEHEPRGAGGEAGQHGNGRGPVVVGDGVVLLHPHRVEAQLLGPGDFLQRLAVVVPALDGDEADVECHTFSSKSLEYHRVS